MQARINCDKYTFCFIKSLENLKNLKTSNVYYLYLGLELTKPFLKNQVHLWDSPFNMGI